MTIKKNTSNIRDEFSSIAEHVYQEKQEEAGFPSPRMPVSIRADMELIANVDELADRLNLTRQACLIKILEEGVMDAVGGYLDVFGEDVSVDFWEKSNQRLLEFRTRQLEKFNKSEGGAE